MEKGEELWFYCLVYLYNGSKKIILLYEKNHSINPVHHAGMRICSKKYF